MVDNLKCQQIFLKKIRENCNFDFILENFENGQKCYSRDSTYSCVANKGPRLLIFRKFTDRPPSPEVIRTPVY